MSLLVLQAAVAIGGSTDIIRPARLVRFVHRIDGYHPSS